MDFGYDPLKSSVNKSTHGIDFEEAQVLWQDEEAIEAPLPFELEDRFMVIGVIGNKLWSATITYRADVIRIISVRRSRKQELDLYDNSRRIR